MKTKQEVGQVIQDFLQGTDKTEQTKIIPSEAKEKKDERIRKHYECPICLEVFQAPTILMCGHTFCQACCKVLKRVVTCAICKESCLYAECRPNYTLQNLILESTGRPITVKYVSKTEREQKTNVEDITLEDIEALGTIGFRRQVKVVVKHFIHNCIMAKSLGYHAYQVAHSDYRLFVRFFCGQEGVYTKLQSNGIKIRQESCDGNDVAVTFHGWTIPGQSVLSDSYSTSVLFVYTGNRTAFKA